MSNRARPLLAFGAALGLAGASLVAPAAAAPTRASKPKVLRAVIARSLDRGVFAVGDAVVFSTRKTTVPTGDRFVAWSIDFGDHTHKSGKGRPPATVNHPYVRPGTYKVVLTVTDSLHHKVKGTYTEKTAKYFTPMPSLGVSVGTAYPWPARTGQSFAVNVDFSAWGPSRTSVDFGDGTAPVSGITKPTALLHTYTHDGTYSITETTTDGLHKSASVTRTAVATSLSVTLKPAVAGQTTVLTTDQVDADGPVNQAGFLIALTVGTHAVHTWSFDAGDGNAPVMGTGTPPSSVPHYYAHAGQPTAELTVTLDDGTVLTSAVPVDVTDPPTLTATTSSDLPLTGSTLTVTLSAHLATRTAWADYGVTWDLAADPDGTFVGGAPPATLQHVYGSADAAHPKTIVVEVDDDHGGYALWTHQVTPDS